jgi:uncharacterized protein YdgA (DUF945 family)
MKKILALVVAAIVVAAWPVATWFYGQRAQNNAEKFAAAITQTVPYLSVASSDYQKGFTTSTQTIRLRPSLPLPVETKLPDIVIENKIEHGPFPGFAGVGAARITHRIVWPAEAKAHIAKLWGEQEPLQMVTNMTLSGGGTTTFKSPAANAKIEKANVAFQGLEGKMNFTPSFANIDYTLNLPGATVEDAEAKMTIGKIASSGAMTKLAGTEKVYIGKQSASFDSLDFTAKGQSAALIKGITYATETTAPEANLLTVTGKLSGAALKFATLDMGTLDYTYSLSKLHAPTIDALSKALQAEMGKPMPAAKPGEIMGPMDTAILNAFKQHLPELSKHVPRFNLDSLRVGTASDYAQMNGSMFLKPVTAQDIANPMMIVPKIDASLNIELSESIVQLIAAQAGQRMMGDQAEMMATLPPEQRALMETQMREQSKMIVDEQLNEIVKQGYLVRGVGKVSAQIALKEGKLTVNGKPVGQGLLPTK